MSRIPTLVVDDDATMRLLLERLLSRVGYAVTTVTNGTDALAAIDKTPWDLVLTDKNLPDLSGVEVARHARTRWPGTTIVMVTGFATAESATGLMGVLDDYFEKPMVLDELARRLGQALSRRRGRAAAAGSHQAFPPPAVVAVLEPDPEARALIIAVLEAEGLAAAGPEAITTADALILSEKASSEAIERAIWEQQATRAEYPVLVISRPHSLRGAQSAVTLWAKALLTYPLDREALSAAVKQLRPATAPPAPSA